MPNPDEVFDASQHRHDPTKELDEWDFDALMDSCHGKKPTTLQYLTLGENYDAMPYGCLIAPNGDFHGLRKYATHGVILAVLEPDQCERVWGGVVPHGSFEDIRQNIYQGFSINWSRHLGYVEISCLYGLAIRVPKNITSHQIAMLRSVLSRCNKMDDDVTFDYGEMPVRKWLEGVEAGLDQYTIYKQYNEQ